MAKKVMPDNEIADEERIGEIDPKVYNSIARCAELLAVQLIESNFSVAPSFFGSDEEGKLGVDFCDINESFDAETQVATCIFQLESFKEIKRKKVFSVRSKFVVFYRIKSDCDELHATAFARKTGLMACYPYFRTHVAHTASLANAEIPILPTISSMPVREKIKKEHSA
ncbi:hypothetical protein [Sphingopyxis sp.]|uniref:hypothetical protein n=1 Tax=Sphingopyxis sp. TaxID=1908224 RepID=UPI0025EB0805|nr:hypothetical protein [Sphingopyxis sp.]MBR2173737.1 hypothetical protein [Sphingopyxis sp.]